MLCGVCPCLQGYSVPCLSVERITAAVTMLRLYPQAGSEEERKRLHRAQQSDGIKSRVKTPCPGGSAFEVGCGILLWSEGSDGERAREKVGGAGFSSTDRPAG